MAPDLYAPQVVRGYLEWTRAVWQIWKIPQWIHKGVRSSLRTYEGIRGGIAKVVFFSSQSLLWVYILFVLSVVLRYHVLYTHDVGDRLPRSVPRWGALPLALILLFLPVSLHLGVFFFLAVPICLLWGYMCRREKVIAMSLSLFIGVTPEIMTAMVSFTPPSEGDSIRKTFELKDGGWSRSKEDALRTWSDQNAWDAYGQFALGVISKRRGDFREAEDRYREVLRLDPSLEHYRKAIRLDDLLAAPHYNLSLMHQDRFELLEGETEFRKAWERDPALVNEYVHLETRNAVKRYTIDAYPKTSLLRSRFLSPTQEKRAAARKVWREGTAWMPLGALRVFAVALVLFLIAANWFSKHRLRLSRACPRCGEAICQRCTGENWIPKGLCFTCHQVYIGAGQVDPVMRIERTRLMDRFSKRRGLIHTVSSLLVPGLGHLLSGRTLRGVFFSALFVLLILHWEARWDFDSVCFFARTLIGRVHLALFILAVLLLYGTVMTDTLRFVRREASDFRSVPGGAAFMGGGHGVQR